MGAVGRSEEEGISEKDPYILTMASISPLPFDGGN